MYISNLENLIIPTETICHLHFISRHVHLSITPEKIFSINKNYNTFTFRSIQVDFKKLLPILFSENTSTLEYEISRASITVADIATYANAVENYTFQLGYTISPSTRNSGGEYEHDKPVQLNRLRMGKSSNCFLFIILSSKEYEHYTYTGQKNTIYFPYATAISDVRHFYTNTDEITNHEPTDFQILHVITSTNANRFLSDTHIRLRNDLHTFVSVKFNVLILELTLGNSGTTHFEVPEVELLSHQDLLLFCYFCLHTLGESMGTQDQYIPVGRYDIKTWDNLRKNKLNFLAPKFWALKLDALQKTQRLDNYNMKNVFRLPKSNKQTLRYAILHLLLSCSNSSLLPTPDTIVFPYVNPEQLFVGYTGLFLLIYGSFRVNWAIDIVGDFGYNFLTCYSYTDPSWSFYVQPFELETWLSIVVYLPILAIFVHVTLVLRNANKSDFNAFFFAYSTLVEYAYGLPDYVFGIKTMRVMIGIWYLISVIFTNAYKGIAITGVAAPAPKLSVTNFYDLLEKNIEIYEPPDQRSLLAFNIFVRLSSYFQELWITSEIKNKSQVDTGVGYAMYEDIPFHLESSNEYTRILVEHTQSIWNRTDLENTSSQYPMKNPYWVLLANFERARDFHKLLVPYSDSNPFYRGNYDIALEREVTNCSRKAIYVDRAEKISREYDYLAKHYNYETFFIGKDVILSNSLTWQFENPRGSVLPATFRKLLESGIYRQLEWFYKQQENLGVRLNYTRSRVTKSFDPVKALNLSSNIHTIFYLFLGGICISVLGHFGERMKILMKSVKNGKWWRKVFIALTCKKKVKNDFWIKATVKIKVRGSQQK